MIRRALMLGLVVAFSVMASSWMYVGYESGEGTPANIMLKKVFALAGVGALIIATVVSITRIDDGSRR